VTPTTIADATPATEPTRDLWFEDIVIGESFTTGSHVVTAEDTARFCDLTVDHHPLHTDEAYARSRGFPGVIAHGLFGLALMEGLKTQLGLYEKSSIASLGWDAVRFLQAVVAGDSVHVTFSFLEKRASSRPGRGVVIEALQLVTQRGDVVIEARHSSLLACRPA
jgi:acyl dehydratase